MTKSFFHRQNAGQPVGGIQFEVYAISSGTAWGVYATEDAKEIEKLNALVKDAKSAVTIITEAEYEASLKKKAGKSGSLIIFEIPQPDPGMQMRGAQPAVVVEQAPVPEAPVAPVGRVEDASAAVATAVVGEAGEPAEAPAEKSHAHHAHHTTPHHHVVNKKK